MAFLSDFPQLGYYYGALLNLFPRETHTHLFAAMLKVKVSTYFIVGLPVCSLKKKHQTRVLPNWHPPHVTPIMQTNIIIKGFC